ncbi:sugar phosphate nucleotidyltransferase [Caldinitratiruptor microaerophilus]|uniref:Uncharacterized protein n=1 Tax=Caldinitratiruptor microaerophilus TaxID=671077 RepID=A0AA35CP63_9FIRM|nr:sugar phosphate nucleotidyltransferase [Caldinitratiruptor microaerophilus]BDG62259.1 hypothetical protein caldi_33490 [Caldinitratiruptor microaerophilus]
MKAVIMAGGEGNRLRPLTCDRPKPLVPICNRPVLGYSLSLLRRHGFEGAVVTLGHRAGQVEAYLAGEPAFPPEREGPLRHVVTSVEPAPLGTAGSVAAAWRADPVGLGGTLVVLSGDGLTDIDLSALVAFHRARRAQVTLAVTRVADPREYGVVEIAPDGAVTRFLEKPARDEAFADTVNTGVYVLEAEVLELVPPHRAWDFSRDLFPALLAGGARVYGWVAGGYWCDVGEPRAYRQANLDLLAGRTAFRPPGEEVAPGVWLEEAARLDPPARLEGPVLLGRGARVEAGAILAGGVVVGQAARVEAGARLYAAVVGEGAVVGAGAAVTEAVVAAGARVGAGAAIHRDAVVGPGARIGEGASVHPGVHVWADRGVAAAAEVRRHVIWSDHGAGPGDLFRGTFGTDLDPVRAVRLGEALGSALGPGPVAVGADPHPAAATLARAFESGLTFAGRRVVTLPPAGPALLAWAVRRCGAAGGVHVPAPGPGGTVELTVVGRGGGSLTRDEERRLERAAAGPGPVAGVGGPDGEPPAPGEARPFPEAPLLFLRETVQRAVRGAPG